MPQDIVGTIVKFNSQTASRDRLFRLMQYTSKLIWAALEKPDKRDVIIKLKKLEASISVSRKLFRLGRSVDYLYTAMDTVNLPDTTLRITLTFSKISMALYLLTDNLIWLNAVGVKKIDKQKWTDISYRFWLYAVLMNLVRDFYEMIHLHHIWRQNYYFDNMYINPGDPLVEKKPYAYLQEFMSFLRCFLQHKNVAADTIKNVSEVWLPLSSLGVINLSPTMVGILGVISSIAGILPSFDSSYKLSLS